MKTLIRVSLLLMVFPIAAGMNCQNNQTTCPDGNECQPRCIRVSAAGEQTVVDCQCIPSDQCHIAFGSPEPNPPTCVGVCPTGFTCQRTETHDPADGSTTYCCECEQEPPDGDPDDEPPTPDKSLIIKSVAADAAKDQLLISGEFGAEQGIVTISGATLTVVSWGTPGPLQQIVCNLPREAFGNVQVQIGTRFSNIAQLTRWDLTLVSKTRTVAAPPSSGERNIEFTNTFIIRSCLNNLLGATGNFGSFASVSRASTGDLNAFGTITNPPSGGNPAQSLTFSKLPLTFNIVYPGDSIDPAGDRFSARNFVCGATRGIGGGIKLLYSVAGFYQITDSIGPSVGEQATGYATNTYFDTSAPVLFFFDGGFNIIGGNMPGRSDPTTTLEWEQAGAQAPPVD